MGRNRRLPIDTLALPYRCGDPGCPCEGPADPLGEDYVVQVRPDERGWRAAVRDERGMVVDVFREHTLNAALEAVHREYPGARFDPEE